MRRDDIVVQARGFLNTPFHHQGRVKGVGVDCVGLVVCVARALGVPVRDRTDYGREPSGDLLRQACEDQLTRIHPGEAMPGDVALFRIVMDPQHVAILGDYPGGGLSLIHAYATVGKVVESNFSDSWRRRLVACYRLPGAE